MKKYLAIPALATLTTLAALAVTGCGTPTSPAAVTTPDAQQLASCQYANNNCPLGHAYKMYGNVGRPTQYSYTVTADKVVTKPGNVVSVEFTVHGLTGYPGDGIEGAGQNASVQTSIGRTRYAFTSDFSFDGSASGCTTTGWVTFNPLPDGVTAQAIQWDNNGGTGPVTWVIDWSSGY